MAGRRAEVLCLDGEDGQIKLDEFLRTGSRNTSSDLLITIFLSFQLSSFLSLSDGISSQIQLMMSDARERILSSLKATVEDKHFLLQEEKAMILTAHCPLYYIFVFESC